MDLEWMGRYRELVRELIYHSNSAALNRNYHLTEIEDGVILTKHDYQVLEFLLEFKDRDMIQAEIAQELGLMPSMMTTVIKHLLSLGLIERYHIRGNRKSIVPKITQKGEALYWAYCRRDAQPLFEPFFALLSSISDENLETFVQALRFHNKRSESFGNMHLDKIKETPHRVGGSD